MNREVLERRTGSLFERLWSPYDEEQFRESTALFRRRLDRIGFDVGYFKGKRVLDAGCGGGRNTIAMACLGAAEANGIDIGAAGIEDAKRRAADLDNVRFQVASILDIPFEDASMDLVWCAGVLMITADEDRALDELTRVLKPGGNLYLLVYADEGMRWPLINTLRPLAQVIGHDRMLAAMRGSRIGPSKERTFLDDLYCPKLDFYNWPRLQRMLEKRGYEAITRWPDSARYDHEHDLVEYRTDMEALQRIFAHGRTSGDEVGELFGLAHDLVADAVASVRWFETAVEGGRMTLAEAMQCVIGQGHHRVLATRGNT